MAIFHWFWNHCDSNATITVHWALDYQAELFSWLLCCSSPPWTAACCQARWTGQLTSTMPSPLRIPKPLALSRTQSPCNTGVKPLCSRSSRMVMSEATTSPSDISHEPEGYIRTHAMQHVMVHQWSAPWHPMLHRNVRHLWWYRSGASSSYV